MSSEICVKNLDWSVLITKISMICQAYFIVTVEMPKIVQIEENYLQNDLNIHINSFNHI